MARCLFFLGEMGLGLDYTQLLGSILSYGDFKLRHKGGERLSCRKPRVEW